MLRKLKNWLIIKLGGYIVPPTKINRITVEPVTIFASTGMSREELFSLPSGVSEICVKDGLARSLAREIVNRNLCVVERTDEAIDCVIFKTSIKVIPTLREYKDNGNHY